MRPDIRNDEKMTRETRKHEGYDPNAPHGSLTKTIVGDDPQLPFIVRANLGAMKLFFWGGIIVFGIMGSFLNFLS